MENTVVLTSEYWPKGSVIPIRSESHERIKEAGTPILVKDLNYHEINESDTDDFNNLIQECFPNDFKAASHLKKDPNILLLGCYWRPPGASREILVGNIIVFTKKLVRWFDHTLAYDKAKLKLLQCSHALKFLSNIKTYYGVHIMIVGVIQEARRMGIASELIRQSTRIVIERYKDVVVESLRVLASAEGAIKAYEKLGFKHVLTNMDFYAPSYPTTEAKFYIIPLPKC